MTMTIFADRCIWTDREVLYVSKESGNVKIIERDYGYGATDSGPPIVKNFKVKEISKYFIKATEINIDEIDHNNWIKTKKPHPRILGWGFQTETIF